MQVCAVHSFWLLSSIPLYDVTIFVFLSLAGTAMHIPVYVCLSRHLWGCNRSGIVGSWGMSIFTVLDMEKQFFPSLYVSSAEAKSSAFLATLDISCHLT